MSVVKRLSEAGIPVMAHVGLLPQRHNVKPREGALKERMKIVTDAPALEEAGAFAVVVEAVPPELGRYLTDRLKVPTIGIRAGPWTSGQVCVLKISDWVCNHNCFAGTSVRRRHGDIMHHGLVIKPSLSID